jgi:hypothetical protein
MFTFCSGAETLPFFAAFPCLDAFFLKNFHQKISPFVKGKSGSVS